MTGDANTDNIYIPIDFLLGNVDDIIVVYNTDNELLAASESLYTFFGIKEPLESKSRFIPIIEDSAWLDTDYEKQQFFSRPYEYPVMVEMMTRDGNQIINWERRPVYDDNNRLQYIVAVGKPKEERRESLKNLIYYDDLTGLLKRNYLFDVLEKKTMSAESPAAGVMIQLKQLENMARLLGEKTANKLVVSAARKLEELTPEGCTICRIAENRFFVFYPGYRTTAEVKNFAGEIVEALRELITDAIKEVSIQAAAGIAYYPKQVSSMSGLLYYANVALNHVNGNSKRGICEFVESFKEEAIDNYVLMKDLKRAIKDDEFIIHYQPIIDPETMSVEAVEALVRWNHPDYGMISPMKFIKLAEVTGVMNKIGICVMEKVKQQMEEWNAEGLSKHAVSINIAACQMTEPHFDRTVARIFKGIDISRIRFELTDCAALETTDVVLKNIENLRKLGIKIAIGDLGLEFAKLSQLDQFEFDVIKVDKFFVQQSESGKVSGLVMEMLKKLMVAMNTIYIKEGIETKEQLTAMKDLGFSLMQGYYFSKPVDAEEITKMIRDGIKSER